LKKKHKCTKKLLIPPESISVLQFEKQNKTKNRLKQDEETIESRKENGPKQHVMCAENNMERT
jgi:hypothetical protein